MEGCADGTGTGVNGLGVGAGGVVAGLGVSGSTEGVGVEGSRGVLEGSPVGCDVIGTGVGRVDDTAVEGLGVTG